MRYWDLSIQHKHLSCCLAGQGGDLFKTLRCFFLTAFVSFDPLKILKREELIQPSSSEMNLALKICLIRKTSFYQTEIVWQNPRGDPFLPWYLPCGISFPRDQIGTDHTGFSQGPELWFGLHTFILIFLFSIVMLYYCFIFAFIVCKLPRVIPMKWVAT